MFKNEDLEFDLNQQISRQKAFLIIIILSFIVASYTVIAAKKIVDNAQASMTFNMKIRERLNSELLKNSGKNVIPNNAENAGK